MRLLYWSKRALIVCVAIWAALILVYTTLGLGRIEVMRPPYNVMLMLLVATATAGSGSAWLAGLLLAQHERTQALVTTLAEKVGELESRVDTRDGRLYYSITSTGKELARLREAVEHTADLGRGPALTVVGAGASPSTGLDPAVLDLSRKIHRRMLEGGDPA